jgi:hypothetical protein
MYKHLVFALPLLLTASTAYCQTDVVTPRILPPTILPAVVKSTPPNTSINHKLDYNNGFRDFHFGQEFHAHESELKFLFTDGTSNFYERKNENLKAGYATLTRIYYVFTNGKLSTIVLKLKGQADSDLMKKALVEQYGNTEENSYTLGHYEWKGQQVSLSFNAATLDREEARVIYMGLPQ